MRKAQETKTLYAPFYIKTLKEKYNLEYPVVEGRMLLLLIVSRSWLLFMYILQ